jgi:hypothetical protein
VIEAQTGFLLLSVVAVRCHMIGSEGSASASENRASAYIRAHACYRLRLTLVPVRDLDPHSLTVSFAGGSSILSGLPLEIGPVDPDPVQNDSELAGERDLGGLGS